VPAVDDNDNDSGEIDGMNDGQGDWIAGRRPAPVPLWPTQIPHMTWSGL
jgi:hypothetical protein